MQQLPPDTTPSDTQNAFRHPHVSPRIDDETQRNWETIEKTMKRGKWRRKSASIEDIVSTFHDKIRRAINQHRCHGNNLTRKERQLLRSIRGKGTLHLSQADKSMGPVVADMHLFVKECSKHLYDTKGTYKLESKPGRGREEILAEAIDELRTLVNFLNSLGDPFKQLGKGFLHYAIEAARKDGMSLFYIIWKIHKPVLSSRPISPSIETITTAMSQWLHYIFVKPVMQHQFVLRDSRELLRRLASFNACDVSKHQIFVTADVTALYPSIELQDGLKALKWFMDNFTPWDDKKKSAVTRIAEYVLTHNFIRCEFLEGKPIFRQVIGTAMGISFSVCYAIIFMIWLESPIVLQAIQDSHICSGGYGRFIDDLFVFWQGPRSALLEFMKAFDLRLPSIKLEWSHGETLHQPDTDVNNAPTPFMDIEVGKKGGMWTSNLFSKKNCAFAYPLASTFQQPSIAKAWIKAEGLRIMAISGTEEMFRNNMDAFKIRLTKREYKLPMINSVLAKIKWETRNEILFGLPNSKTKTWQYGPTLKLPYIPRAQSIKEILRSDELNEEGLPSGKLVSTNHRNLAFLFNRKPC